ncbi:MAG: hypothetical protein Q4A65_06690 [Bacillota bacterium]|nr:hypothetical protein [Bacillota bacterium]
MAKRINPIGRIVGGSLDNCFIFWLIEKDGTEYFAISPNQILRVGIMVHIDDNPITCKIYPEDIVRVETKDEAFLHEDFHVYTKTRGKLPMRVNRQAADKLKSVITP